MRNVVIADKSFAIIGGVVGGWVSVIDVCVVVGTIVVIICCL